MGRGTNDSHDQKKPDEKGKEGAQEVPRLALDYFPARRASTTRKAASHGGRCYLREIRKDNGPEKH